MGYQQNYVQQVYQVFFRNQHLEANDKVELYAVSFLHFNSLWV